MTTSMSTATGTHSTLEGAVPAAPAAAEPDSSTREHVLHLIVAQGPISAGDLADTLQLTPPAVRRHLAALESDGQIVAREAPGSAKRGRGRPAKRYVATESAHEVLSDTYSELAIQALDHLARVAGEVALLEFAQARSAELERRFAPAVDAAGPDVAARARALARALNDDGFEATTRPVAGMIALQLCQGHCPVQHVAARFPQLCEAETVAFSHLLGVHVQRLATLAGGEHVCTTHIPTFSTPTATTPTATIPTSVEGPR